MKNIPVVLAYLGIVLFSWGAGVPTADAKLVATCNPAGLFFTYLIEIYADDGNLGENRSATYTTSNNPNVSREAIVTKHADGKIDIELDVSQPPNEPSYFKIELPGDENPINIPQLGQFYCGSSPSR